MKIPLFLFILLSPFTPFLDLYFSQAFYSDGHFYDNAFFHFLFVWGERTGFLFGGAALFIFFLSFLKRRFKKWRKPALSMVLTLVIGAGLVTNLFLKGYWGRPRPKQIVEFGGKHLYRPFWKPDFHTQNDPQKSFPSGHVAMGFYFLSLCLAAKRLKSQPLFYLGLMLTVVLGGGLMIARVAQGGHFFSDVIFAALLMGYIALFVDKIVFKDGRPIKVTGDNRKLQRP